MSRLIILIVAAVLLIGALFYLQSVPRETPAKTLEVAVPQGGNAS